MILGIVKIAFGIYQECSNSDNTGLIKILEGLELIFVAPLSYLLILSLTKYISATKPEINPSLEIKKKYINHSSLEITNVKILTTSLFISILLLHSIRLILQKEMSYNLIIYVLSLIVILIVYYLMLDSVANKLRAKNQDS